MSTSFTHATLVATLQSMTEDLGSEFLAFVDTVIPLGEDRVLRDLDLEIFDTTATGSMTSGNPLLAKPAGFVAGRALWYTNGSGNQMLIEPRSFEYVKEYWPNSGSTTAAPKYYAEYDNAGTPAWYIGGTPASAIGYTARYVKRPVGLTSSNTTTWLSTTAGDVLLMACLIAGEQYLKADERIATWKTDYTERLSGSKSELRQSARAWYGLAASAAPGG